jgi:hypothetical protein
MFRYKILGTTGYDRAHPSRVLIVYVTASSRDEALDRAFDDMGLMAVTSIRKIGKRLS